MILIAAIDDRKGLMFNNRRQSQDRFLRQRIRDITVGSRLWVNSYTSHQFSHDGDVENLVIDDSIPDTVPNGEYCFIENISASSAEDKIERIILFKWNRKYPGDFFFDIDVTNEKWNLVSSKDFPGSSHEKITMEVFDRCR